MHPKEYLFPQRDERIRKKTTKYSWIMWSSNKSCAFVSSITLGTKKNTGLVLTKEFTIYLGTTISLFRCTDQTIPVSYNIASWRSQLYFLFASGTDTRWTIRAYITRYLVSFKYLSLASTLVFFIRLFFFNSPALPYQIAEDLNLFKVNRGADLILDAEQI